MTHAIAAVTSIDSAMIAHSPVVAVVGAGVVGLTTALELRSRGATVRVYADESGAPPASRIAPALFTPYPGPDEDHFRSRTERSYAALADIAREHGDESGVHMGTLHEYQYSSSIETRGWLDRLMNTRPILPLPAGLRHATSSLRPHMDMRRYLPWLEHRAVASGVTFVRGHVSSFMEVVDGHTAAVVNCAGLGSRSLAGDRQMKPMHGQVIHVANDIGLDRSIHDDAPGGMVAYIFVFGDRLVLGGTFDADREDHTIDPSAIEAILDRCRGLLRLDGHPRWNDLARGAKACLAGVRPTRGPDGAFEHIRVEREETTPGAAVIHNYGHGRAGVSLSWGTAAEAASLALASCVGRGGAINRV